MATNRCITCGLPIAEDRQVYKACEDHGVKSTNKNIKNEKEKNTMKNNQKVIVRADRAGVFYGEIKERNGSEVVMINVRRIWYWDGAASLSQLATEGTTNPSKCKFTVYVPEITILGVIEIIPCSDKAVKSIEGVAEWKR